MKNSLVSLVLSFLFSIQCFATNELIGLVNKTSGRGIPDARVIFIATTNGVVSNLTVTGILLLNGQDMSAIVSGWAGLDSRFVNTGEVNSISANMILTNAITTTKIVNGAITSEKIADGAITAILLGPDCVTSTNIADNAILWNNFSPQPPASGDVVLGSTNRTLQWISRSQVLDFSVWAGDGLINHGTTNHIILDIDPTWISSYMSTNNTVAFSNVTGVINKYMDFSGLYAPSNTETIIAKGGAGIVCITNNRALYMSGGSQEGSTSGANGGGVIAVYGNSASFGGGDVLIFAGNTNSSGKIQFRTSQTNLIVITRNGDLDMGGGNVINTATNDFGPVVMTNIVGTTTSLWYFSSSGILTNKTTLVTAYNVSESSFPPVNGIYLPNGNTFNSMPVYYYNNSSNYLFYQSNMLSMGFEWVISPELQNNTQALTAQNTPDPIITNSTWWNGEIITQILGEL